MPVRPLSPELAEKARVELNEDPNRIESDLQHIKDWLAKQPHIRARTDDQWLVIFLRSCKYSLERAKEKLDLYYTMRTAVPEFNGKPEGARFFEILDLGSMVVLPKPLGPGKEMVSLFRPGVYDPAKYSLFEIMAVTSCVQRLVLLECDNAVVAGIKSVMDLEGTTMAHLMQMTPLQMKKAAVFSQEAAPVRMKGMHYLKAPSFFESIFNTFKGFLNEKNRSRINFHKTLEDLYEHIPKEFLPAEYGGNAGTIKEINEYWKKKIADRMDWLDEDSTFGTDESKRPGKPKTSEDLFGIEGSFRQLQFD